MNPVGNVMILASAGSGKTYALTNRFVRLLALGARPDRIVALTFTRKAAGEFFDEILKKLARAASDRDYARQLLREIDLGETADAATGASAEGMDPRAVPPADFLKLLRSVVDEMHRLQLGTLDGFFARIARNFPFELGLTGEFSILQEHAARVERRRVLRRMFERTGELAAAQREFIEAFKRATFGAEEKRLGVQLDAFLDEHQEIFLSARDRSYWANPQRIWPQGSRWLGQASDPAEPAKRLLEWATNAPLGDKQRARWTEFLDAWAEWTPGTVPARPLVYVLEKAFEAWPALLAGRAVLQFDRKKQELTPGAAAALADLTRHVMRGEIARRLEITQGIHAVLESYESVYQNAVRRTGKLTFGDVQRLLMPDQGAPILTSAPAVGTASSGDQASDERELRDSNRLLIDYRLDAKSDHWLLDEFQDTSFGQWSILRNLIDEVVQDPTGARSFFYVGDIKQAIFAWREGDPRLFREIFDHYNSACPGTITEEHLVKSWRSGLPIIETVNRVFGAAPVLRNLFPGTASELWNREWRAHESARPGLNGQSAFLLGETELDRCAIALAVIDEIQPLARGLSCALLVQDNATAARLADYLRQEGGLPARADSDLHVCTDNPLGAVLLSLVKVAAHPGDTLAWEHVCMTPLRGLLEQEGIHSAADLTLELLGRIHQDGFDRVIRDWTRRLLPHLTPDDAFTRERGRQIATAAALFDATGSRDVAEFVDFMERHVVRDTDAENVIRVMTIHKSKGLGFDVVILPDLEGTKLDSRRDGLAVQKAPDRSVEWVLDLPAKLFHQHDEVLAEHVRAAEADACYECLSLLYVAMTRAKRAMYFICKEPGASTSRNYPRMLTETLGGRSLLVTVGNREFSGSWTVGDPLWHEAIARAAVAPAVRPALDRVAGVGRGPRLASRKPSDGDAAEIPASQLFSPARHDAAEFGTGVHRLLAEVTWIDDVSNRRLEMEWGRRGLAATVVAEALACLRAPALTWIWSEAEGPGLAPDRRITETDVPLRAELWRERAFEVAMAGVWITGVFDRVVVHRNAAGVAVAADVIDFKTDRVAPGQLLADAVTRHSGQLDLYRSVVATLSGLPIRAVRCYLVFTRLGECIELPRERK